MRHQAIPHSAAQSMIGIGSAADRVRTRVNTVVTSIKDIYSDPRTAEQAPLEIEPLDDARCVANVMTPTGKGRLVLNWGSDDTGLMGILVVERERFDEYDRLFWEPVWSINVPQYGNPWIGEGETCFRIRLDDHFGTSRPQSIFEAGLSIMAAIVIGPQPTG